VHNIITTYIICINQLGLGREEISAERDDDDDSAVGFVMMVALHRARRDPYGAAVSRSRKGPLVH